MWGVVPVESGTIQNPAKELHVLSTNSRLIKGMASCHSLTLINDTLVGDPLDVKVDNIIHIFK